jgi:choline dehydrogenase-like flavoprotein
MSILNVSIGNMNPQSQGTISVTSTDPTMPPLIDANLFSHPYDRRVMIEGMKMVMDFFNAPKIKPYLRGFIQGPKSGSEEDIIVSKKAF